ncbi:MAG: Rieske (2Fe-2S) protein [Chloroflexota bacterium]
MKAPEPERLTLPPDGRSDAEQPRWRRDFPIDWPRDNYVSRRDFTKFMVLTSLAFVVGQFWILIQSLFRQARADFPAQEIARLDEIPIGGSLVFQYADEHSPRLLVRLSGSSFVAYDQQCTHLTCPVIPRPEEGHLHCPCHEGLFDLATGRPLAGPPSRPLPRVKLEIRGDKVYAVGLEESLTS